MPMLTGFVAADTYARYRSGLRRRMLAYKNQRTVVLGPHMRLLFEDRLTVSYQTLETMHAERFDSAFDEEENLTRFAHLIPDSRSLCATLMIELTDAGQRRRLLGALNEAVHEICLEVDGLLPVRASLNADLPDQHRARPSAVHFLRFDLPRPARAALLDEAGACLSCRHCGFDWEHSMAPALLARLRADLGPGAWVDGLATGMGMPFIGAT